MISNTISIEKIKEITIPILSNYPVSKAVLFGLYAKGKSSKNSDIDLIDKSHIEPDSAINKKIEKEGMVIYEKSKDYPKNN